MMNKSLTPYLHCTRLRRVTAPQPTGADKLRPWQVSERSPLAASLKIGTSLFLTDNNNNNNRIGCRQRHQQQSIHYTIIYRHPE